MSYDAASRLTTSTLGGVTTTYTFDSNGNLTGVNGAGTLTTMVYDKENRLKEHRRGNPETKERVPMVLNSPLGPNRKSTNSRPGVDGAEAFPRPEKAEGVALGRPRRIT